MRNLIPTLTLATTLAFAGLGEAGSHTTLSAHEIARLTEHRAPLLYSRPVGL